MPTDTHCIRCGGSGRLREIVYSPENPCPDCTVTLTLSREEAEALHMTVRSLLATAQKAARHTSLQRRAAMYRQLAAKVEEALKHG